MHDKGPRERLGLPEEQTRSAGGALVIGWARRRTDFDRRTGGNNALDRRFDGCRDDTRE